MDMSVSEECKNPKDCTATTNIAEEVERGWGKLDFNGFWEHTCEPCTRNLRDTLKRMGL